MKILTWANFSTDIIPGSLFASAHQQSEPSRLVTAIERLAIYETHNITENLILFALALCSCSLILLQEIDCLVYRFLRSSIWL